VDLYKYLEPRLKVYVNPMLFAERREVPLFEDGDPVLIPEVTQYGGSISIGREFGRMASVDVGVRVFTGDVEIKVGPPDQDGIDFDGGEYFVKGIYDRLDDRYFPGDGSLVSAQYLKSASWLGADDDYEQVIVDALIARSFGRHTAMGGVRYYETLSDTAPVYGLFRAGGFLRLSGLQQGEIVGQNFAMGLAGYRYHFAGSGLLPAYVGMTLEYGQVAADAGDLFNDGLFAGSLYVGYRSPVGPLYVGMALAQEGRQAFFLRIGNVFGNSTIGR
jgi:NTE family protein